MLEYIGLPLGLLGVISLGGLYDFRMNMVAGGFWLLLSPTLAQFVPFLGAVGALVGLAHLGYFIYCIRSKNTYKIKVEVPKWKILSQ